MILANIKRMIRRVFIWMMRKKVSLKLLRIRKRKLLLNKRKRCKGNLKIVVGMKCKNKRIIIMKLLFRGMLFKIYLIIIIIIMVWNNLKLMCSNYK